MTSSRPTWALSIKGSLGRTRVSAYASATLKTLSVWLLCALLDLASGGWILDLARGSQVSHSRQHSWRHHLRS